MSYCPTGHPVVDADLKMTNSQVQSGETKSPSISYEVSLCEATAHTLNESGLFTYHAFVSKQEMNIYCSQLQWKHRG